MSSEPEQPTLDVFDIDEQVDPHEEALANRGAAYRPERGDDNWSRPPEDECLNCGRDVSPQIARVLGDNNGCIPGCASPECRKQVIDDGVLSEDSHQVTARVVRTIRSNDGGESVVGGRR